MSTVEEVVRVRRCCLVERRTRETPGEQYSDTVLKNIGVVIVFPLQNPLSPDPTPIPPNTKDSPEATRNRPKWTRTGRNGSKWIEFDMLHASSLGWGTAGSVGMGGVGVVRKKDNRYTCEGFSSSQTPRTSPSNPPRLPLLRGPFGIGSTSIRY